MPTPTVSVIVPNYNHARYLRKRVDSILAQTYQDFELILLDDCSTDNSREVLASYAGDRRVRIEYNEKNSGTPFKQWNKGVRMARGKYVWIAESDDYAEPQLLERLVGILNADEEVTFAYCRAWTVGENDVRFGFSEWYFSRLEPERWTKDFVADGQEECRRSFALYSPVPNASTVVLRREVYEQVGGANEEMLICADYMLWAKLAVEGRLAYVAEPLSNYRTHGDNARTRGQQGVLDLAEYFYAMRSVVERVSGDAAAGRSRAQEIYGKMPLELGPKERVEAAQQALDEIADWNFHNNRHVTQEAMRAYFLDWEFALVGKEFALAPPSRWRFFLHRIHFYRRYSPGMNWKQKLVNLLRVVGAPLVGYRSRHWPEQAYSWIANAINRAGS